MSDLELFVQDHMMVREAGTLDRMHVPSVLTLSGSRPSSAESYFAGISIEEKIAWLDRVRRDPNLGRNMHPADATRLPHQIVDFHQAEDPSTGQSRLQDPQTFVGATVAPTLFNYIKGCSYVNLCKLLILETTNPMLFSVWGNTLAGRTAGKCIEGYLGKELTLLTEICDNVLVSQVEKDRLEDLYSQNPGCVKGGICEFYLRGTCRLGSRCPHVHVTEGPRRREKGKGKGK